MRSAKHVIAGLIAVGLVAAVSIPAVAAPIGKLPRPFGFHAAEQPSAQSAFDQVSHESSTVAAAAGQASSPPGLAKGHVKTDDHDDDVEVQLASTLQENHEPEDPAALQAKYNAIAEHFKSLDAAQFGSLDAAAVQSLHRDQQIGLGAIVRLLSLADETNRPYTDLLNEHKAGKGWGELARENNIHPGSLQNPGAVFGGKGKAGAAGGPPGLAAGGSPGLVKAKAKGAAKGKGVSGQ